MQDRDEWEGNYNAYGRYNEHNSHSYSPKKGWDTGTAPKVCENCDFTPKDRKQKIRMDYEVWKVLMGLCSTVKVEWQALLKGTIDADGVVNITGYYIPKQQVGPTYVKNLDVIDDVFIAENNIVAGVHSHANMNCFFSSTDHDDTNMSLIKHNIVVNNKGEYKATTRVELPCGMVKFIEAEVFTVGEPHVTIVGLSNIEEKTWGFQTPTTWGAKDDKVDGKKTYDGVIDGMRYCPVCDMLPEEDSGASCLCWTKNMRHMLPDFTKENYEWQHNRTWELKPALLQKFKTK